MSSISLGVSALVAIDSFTDERVAVGDASSRARSWAATSRSGRARNSRRRRRRWSTPGARRRRRGPDHGRSRPWAWCRASGLARVSCRSGPSSPRYPFYGEITTEPAGSWSRLQDGAIRHRRSGGPRIPRRARRRHADAGDGALRHPRRHPERAGRPGRERRDRAAHLHTRARLSETGLLVFGSRAEYETLLKLPPALSPARFAARFNPVFSTRHAARSPARRSPKTRSTSPSPSTQLGNFLGIVGLVALLLGGIGVASGVHAFVMRKIDTVAILRCLGATSGQVLVIYVLQAAAMGLLGALAGAALGVAVQFALPWALQEFLPVDVTVRLAPAAIGLGLGIGVWVALIFSLRPLLSLRGVSPLADAATRVGRGRHAARAPRFGRPGGLVRDRRQRARHRAVPRGLHRAGAGLRRSHRRRDRHAGTHGAAAVVGRAAPDASALVVRAAPGRRQPLSPGQPDTRRHSRTWLRRCS